MPQSEPKEFSRAIGNHIAELGQILGPPRLPNASGEFLHTSL